MKQSVPPGNPRRPADGTRLPPLWERGEPVGDAENHSMRDTRSSLSLWQQWREDVGCVFEHDPAARGLLEVVLTYPGIHALLWHRISHRLWHAGWRFTARFVAYGCRFLTNIDIHPAAKIGRRLFIDHGAGVVIGETAEVGDDVTLYHGVTLGGTSWNKAKRHPTLGNHVLIGAGAKILGPITLGDKVRVGANSVVNKNVPACCTVVGIPGRMVQRKGLKLLNPYGIDLDHHEIPDPVGKALACLMERVEELEARLAEQSRDDCRDCEAQDVCEPLAAQPVKRAARA